MFDECNHQPADVRERTLTQIAAAGATWVRTYISWAHGTAELAGMDACAADSRRLGLRLLVTLLDAPAASGGANPDPSAYAAALGALAARYRGQVAAWEVWNEPNLADFYSGDAADYVALLRVAAPAIKAADPAATVVAAGLSLSDRAYLEQMYASGFATAGADVVAVHPYPYGEESPGKVYGDPANTRGLEAVTAFRDTMVAHGDRRPVWITEAGWSTVYMDEETQADYVTVALDYVRDRLPFVDVFVWFQALDWCCSAWERGMALIRGDGSPRPGYGAFLGWRHP